MALFSMTTVVSASAPGSEAWCAAQVWLGLLAYGPAQTASLDHFTRVKDVLAARGPSLWLVRTLNGRARCLLNLDRIPEAAGEARRALALARELNYPAGQALALYVLGGAAHYLGDHDNGLAWLRQAQEIDSAALPGATARRCEIGLAIGLMSAGEFILAERACARALDLARQAGDLDGEADCLSITGELDWRMGRVSEAAAHLREAIQLGLRTGSRLFVIDSLDQCGHLCAEIQHWGEAITMWAAHAACLKESGILDVPHDARYRQEQMQKARQALGPARTRAAQERGAAMRLATAAEFALLLFAEVPPEPAAAAAPRLSTREQELVTLVAQGRTDAQIAAQLYISVRTVRSHLDRIRDKSGCRRRADLTRLALQAHLV
jgi:DNA-binding CsgD family transcriptional regulator